LRWLKAQGAVQIYFKYCSTFDSTPEGNIGYALYVAQTGKKHEKAKALRGFGSAGILEIVEDWRGNTYRAAYTVRFSAAVFVLHVFQNKAKHGIATPRQDMGLIRERLKIAE
jgi:phage-related protein